MEQLIRTATHDNEQFDAHWSDFHDQLRRAADRSWPSSTIDTLVEYLVQEPTTPPPSEAKFDFLHTVIRSLDYDKAKATDKKLLDHLSQVFVRVFEQARIDLWYATFLAELFEHFQLNKCLPERTPLVEQLLTALQKHAPAINSQDEKVVKAWKRLCCSAILDHHLLNEKTLDVLREPFQQLFRFAIQNAASSSFWSEVKSQFTRYVPQLFNTSVKLTDAHIDLELCCTHPDPDYRKLVLKAFVNDAALFKANYLAVLQAIEHYLTTKDRRQAEDYVNDVLLKHSSSIPDLEPLLRLLIRVTPQISPDQREEFACRIIDNVASKLHDIKASKTLWPLFFDLAVVALETHTMRGPSAANQLLSKENFYPWKELIPRIACVVELCGSYDDVRPEKQSYFNPLDSLHYILTTIHERTKTYAGLFQGTHSPALTCILRWASSASGYTIHVYKMARAMINLIDRKQVTLEVLAELLQKLHDRMGVEDDADETEGTEYDFFTRLAEFMGDCMETLKTLTGPMHALLNALFLTILAQPLQNERGAHTFGYDVTRVLWAKFIVTVVTEDDARAYEQSAARLHYVARNEVGDESDVFRWWSDYWTAVGQRFPQVAAGHSEIFLSELLDREQIVLVHLLMNLYPLQPEPFHARLDQLIQTCFQSQHENQYRGVYLILLQVITKLHPEKIELKHMEHISKSFPPSSLMLNDTELYGVFQFLTPVAGTQPDLFDPYQEKFLRLARDTQNYCVVYCFQQYAISSATAHGPEAASRSLDRLIELLRDTENCTPTNRSVILLACETIGTRFYEVLKTKRAELDELGCTKLVHLIDHRQQTEENKQATEQSRQDIETMGERLQKTETNVDQVHSVVKRQEVQMTNVRADVNHIDTRLQDVTARVDVHQKEIERIDAKTLSYAPAWAAAVCKLLNRRAPNDWRLLGRRFGYSASELKHWATQFDPCMALLNEWYMTHKADEATYGLLKTLKEIGRGDVEDIVRQAVAEAGEIIPETFAGVDIRRLPPVFISYQWNSQPAVAQLKSRLEEAGYACWMDIGQMGGGQELHANIDRGIRGAKVVLCCMNKDYATTDACVAQVNLALTTGKPIIPMQMEKQSWPPEGALGPLMSDYLFIRFFDRKATNDPNFWPTERFTELLGQIRYHAAPDPDMISDRYKNWFVPRADDLIFLKDAKSNSNTAQPSLATTPLIVSHPQVMISYQWDRQTDIVDLYKRLTELGYGVWLDILQMGGGDSLFAKIDAGIRHAQCVIACVTPKYSLSVNCRREMSLADSLSKPIVPVLLEPLKENWPPIGPMSLVFTGKLYLDFQSRPKNDVWHGKEYAQLLVKLKQFVPEVQTENPERHLINMERPTSAWRTSGASAAPAKPRQRPGSAPVVPQSQACSLM